MTHNVLARKVIIFAVLSLVLLSAALYGEVYGKVIREVRENGGAEATGVVDFFDNGKKIASEKADPEKGYMTITGTIPDGSHRIYDGERNDDYSLVCVAEYKDNKRNGIVRTYDPMGVKPSLMTEAMYKDGLASGMAREFYREGSLKKEYTMKKGALEGSYRSFYQGGAVLTEAVLKPEKGKASGVIKSYYPAGALLSEETLENDNVKSLKAYYGNGKIMEKASDIFGYKMTTFYSMTGRGFGVAKEPHLKLTTGDNYSNTFCQGATGDNSIYAALGTDKSGQGLTFDLYDMKNDFKLLSSRSVAGASTFAVASQGKLAAIAFRDRNGKSVIGLYDVNGMVKRGEYVFAGGKLYNGLYFEPKGRWLAGVLMDNNGRLGYFILETGQELRMRKLGVSGPGPVSFSGDGITAAFRADDGANNCIKIFDVASLKEISTVKPDKERYIEDMAISPGGDRLLYSEPRNEADSNDCDNLAILDIKSGSKITLAGDKNGATGLAWYPDGSHVVSGSFAISVWDAGTGSLEAMMSGHGGWVNSFSFTNGGKYLISAGQDSTVKVWDNPVK
jgi:hypothetical protein